jgi:hypothetical protein
MAAVPSPHKDLRMAPPSPLRHTLRRSGVAFLIPVAALCGPALLSAQDRLRTMPRFERYGRLRGEIGRSMESGALAVT